MVAWRAREGYGIETPTGEGVLWNRTTFLEL
jgi:hypothetical protein